jgi:uncharacterized membrane protein YfcA
MIPQDLIPFSQYSAVEVTVIYVTVAASFIIRGAFGFGSNLPFVLVTTWIFGPHHAIVLSVVLAVFGQLQLAHQGVRTADWSVFRSIILGLLAGAAIGAAVFASLDADWLTLLMALLILVVLVMDRYGAFALLGDVLNLRSLAVALPLATLSGTVGSVSGGGGMYFLVAYIKLACGSAASVRGTSLMLSVVYQLGRFVALAVAGFVSLQVLVESVAMLPAVVAGTVAGTRFFRSLSDRRFFEAIQLVLVAGAAVLLVKGVARVLQ